MCSQAVEEIPLTGVIHGQLFVDTCFFLAGLLLAWYDLCRSQAQGFGRSLLLRYIRYFPIRSVSTEKPKPRIWWNLN